MPHPAKPRKNAKKLDKPGITLAPLDFESAVRAALATGKAPPPPPKRKKAKPKAKAKG